jgi:hypothetical protein
LVAYSSAKIDQIRNSLSADLKTLLLVQLQINAKIYILKKRKPNKSPVFQQQNLSEIELQNQDKYRQTALFKKNPAFSAGGYRIQRPTIPWNSED